MGDNDIGDGGQEESEGAGKRRRSKKGSGPGPLHVEVPEWCKEPKPWFELEPTSEIVREIRDWVAETGASHTWRGHTHTRLPEGETRLKYVGRIELPEKFHRKQYLVCPICRPSSANFGLRPGFIAWFPDERVIRLIGPDCYANIDKEGHADALKEFQERERRKSDIAFLVSQRDQHRLALKALNEARLVARAVDVFGPDLRRALDRLNIDLWPNVRTGELQVTETLPNPQRPGALMHVSRRFGSLAGYKLLDPAMKKLDPKFAPHIAFLEEALALSDEEWTDEIGKLDTLPRRDVVKKLGRALDAARNLREQVLNLRAFVSTENLATLRRWGSDETEGKPIAVYARRENSALKIGSWENRTNSVPIPTDLERDIPSVAGLTATKP
jgi:hypothetical protein